MDEQFTNEVNEQLLFVEAGLRSENSRRFSEDQVSVLLAKGLLMNWGTSVRLTPLGEETLFYMRSGGPTHRKN